MILFISYDIAEDGEIKLRNDSAPLRTSFSERGATALEADAEMLPIGIGTQHSQ